MLVYDTEHKKKYLQLLALKFMLREYVREIRITKKALKEHERRNPLSRTIGLENRTLPLQLVYLRKTVNRIQLDINSVRIDLYHYHLSRIPVGMPKPQMKLLNPQS